MARLIVTIGDFAAEMSDNGWLNIREIRRVTNAECKSYEFITASEDEHGNRVIIPGIKDYYGCTRPDIWSKKSSRLLRRYLERWIINNATLPPS